MTYASTTTTLRGELSALLEEAEVLRPRGPRPLTSQDSVLVQRYRASVLSWVNRTMQAVVPAGVTQYDWRWGPARLFADHLNRVVVVSLALTPPASTLQLGTPQANSTVERWRRAAVAATLGLERELPAVTHGPGAAALERQDVLLGARARRPAVTHDYDDRLRVVDDNAALANALVLLDVRTGGRPGWHRLGGVKYLSSRREVSAEGLLNAIDLCRRWTRAHDLSTGVDAWGHREAAGVVAGPIRPGVQGLLDALHNTGVLLEQRPRGDVMRLLIRSQGALAGALVRAVGPDEPLAAALVARRTKYRQLAATSGDLGGRLGVGPEALVSSEQARSLVATIGGPSSGQVSRLLEVLRVIDAKVATHVLQAVHDRTYLVRDGRRLGSPGPGGVRQATDEWKPADVAAPALIQTARGLRQLDAPSTPPAPVSGASPANPRGRASLDAALVAATPALTASSGPLAGEPARSELSHTDGAQLRAGARESTPQVQEALHDYLLRRPTRGGGVATSKAHGDQPSPQMLAGSVRGAEARGEVAASPAADAPRGGRTMQDRAVGRVVAEGRIPGRGPTR